MPYFSDQATSQSQVVIISRKGRVTHTASWAKYQMDTTQKNRSPAIYFTFNSYSRSADGGYSPIFLKKISASSLPR